MPKYTQKWTLVKLLEDLPEGYEYSYKDWPLHITIADIFAVDWENTNLFEKLTSVLSKQKPFEATVGEEAYLGPPGDQKKIVLLNTNPELRRLHDKVVAILDEAGAVYNNPEYVGEGYLPHSTVQKHKRLQKNDRILIDAITVIYFFPGSDYKKRRVLKTIKLAG